MQDELWRYIFSPQNSVLQFVLGHSSGSHNSHRVLTDFEKQGQVHWLPLGSNPGFTNVPNYCNIWVCKKQKALKELFYLIKEHLLNCKIIFFISVQLCRFRLSGVEMSMAFEQQLFSGVMYRSIEFRLFINRLFCTH